MNEPHPVVELWRQERRHRRSERLPPLVALAVISGLSALLWLTLGLASGFLGG